jgi:hypothetical protein
VQVKYLNQPHVCPPDSHAARNRCGWEAHFYP